MKWKLPINSAALKGVLERYKYAILVILVGIFLLLLPTGGKERSPTVQAGGEGIDTFNLAEFEGRLQEILSRIDGAGTTYVVLTLKNDGLQVLAKDGQQSRDGAAQTEVVTISRGSGVQEVVTIRTDTPQFQGALVVCEGGEDPQVQLRISQAVAALTGLGSDKISICKGN